MKKISNKSKKPGRNDPCPCGSGKKYKKCCMLKTEATVGPQEKARARLVDSLFEFAAQFHQDKIGDAFEYFWAGEIPEKILPNEYHDFVEINFNEWFLFDYIIETEGFKTIVDLYGEYHKHSLTDVEKQVLDVFRESVLSLYEVQEVLLNQGLILQDLLIGGEYGVKEKSATRGLFKWDILAARLLLIDGRHILCGSAYPYPVWQKDVFIDVIKENFRRYKQQNRDGSWKDYLKDRGMVFNEFWYGMAKGHSLPELRTKDDEPVMFSRAIFEAVDLAKIRAKLRKHRKIIAGTDDEFTWSDAPGTNGASILGTIAIKGSQLTLECLSCERLEKGKKLLQRVLKDLIVHKGDTVKEPFEAICKVKDIPEPSSTIPIKIQQQLYDKFMRQHLERWIDEEIPALDNKTPRESIKNRRGREKVSNLLKAFENKEERNKRDGTPYHDLGWVWKKLNLEQPE